MPFCTLVQYLRISCVRHSAFDLRIFAPCYSFSCTIFISTPLSRFSVNLTTAVRTPVRRLSFAAAFSWSVVGCLGCSPDNLANILDLLRSGLLVSYLVGWFAVAEVTDILLYILLRTIAAYNAWCIRAFRCRARLLRARGASNAPRFCCCTAAACCHLPVPFATH